MNKFCNRSRKYNARFTAIRRTVSVYRVLQMRGGGYADVLPVLQVPDNKADAVLCERFQIFKSCSLNGAGKKKPELDE